ncbi:MAG: AMP-binding protein [Burkholderiales bacterium]|nr:AMP-binding protein [Burkholderiales bacterium]OUT75890.1 MAG: AMP-dependent synthetase [Betaproteobacteria bacterium TMED22]|tara:strand:- start:3067 stop:4314 length:1248 start_codon:yes stop_codon:yes gene_type:complete
MSEANSFLDSSETRSEVDRETDLIQRFKKQVQHAQVNSDYFKERLKNIDPESIVDRDSICQIPVTRKTDLKAIQGKAPPFGGLTTAPLSSLARLFSSPGPIYEPQAVNEDFWRVKRALYSVGVRCGSLVYNTFSYHFTPAGFMMDEGARALGCAVFPAGVGQTELQVQTIAEIRPDVYTGTPSFLKILLEKGNELGLDLSSLKRGIVGGEALLPSARKLFQNSGIEICQTYATADVGLIAYETLPDQGLIIDEGVLVEIVRPGSDDLVEDGEVGEVVVTVFSDIYPLIRFGTGDLSMFIPGVSACGRTNRRLKGWMGRADQTTKVKGMFVHPEQINAVVKRHPEIQYARLNVAHDTQHNDVMTLECEGATDKLELNASIVITLKELTKLRGAVNFVPTNSLPRDGKVIDDRRKYD